MTIATKLHWLDGPWPGKLALSPRPRGGDWLEDEIAGWKRAGVRGVLSLLTPEEEKELDLRNEANEVKAQGLEYASLPIPDREVPRSESAFGQALEQLNRALAAGKNVVVHCRQGIGRTGLVAACLLTKSGMSPGAAMAAVSAARGIAVPETDQQRDWIERHAPAISK